MNKNKVWEYVKAICTALILALIIRTYIVQAFKIPSGSMIPTLLVGDHLLVNKFIYGTPLPFSDKRVLLFSSPKRGDIIVFKYPEDPSRDFIKRVIATEGDVVEQRDKKVYVNSDPLKEPYAQYTDKSIRDGGSDPRDNFGPYLVPKNKFFVMGDNRDQSYDSRFWGYVDIKEIRGKAFILYWSWDSDKTMPRFGRIGNLIH
ncbi:MAG: signal peptidase I [Nitrospirae bacterium]|nr:MAG: signal peptidase I [Nitrospirota bacterium]